MAATPACSFVGEKLSIALKLQSPEVAFVQGVSGRIYPGDRESAARYQQVRPCLTEVLLDQSDHLPVLTIFRLLQRHQAILVPDIQSGSVFQQYGHHFTVTSGNGQMQWSFQPGVLCIGVRTVADEQFTQIDMAKTGRIVQGCVA